MEDCTFVQFLTGGPEGAHPFFGVFDGHKGNGASFYAKDRFSYQLIKQLNFFLKETRPHDLTDSIIYNTLKIALVALHYEYKGKGGTTANICMIAKNHIYTANVGDSRAILVHLDDGSVELLSEDAKPNDPRHKYIIESLGGTVDLSPRWEDWRINNDLAVGSAIGDHDVLGVNPTVDITKTPIPNSDTLLVMASDGVWGVAAPNRLGEALASRMKGTSRTSMQEIAEDIVASSLQKGSRDNMSVIAVKIPAHSTD